MELMVWLQFIKDFRFEHEMCGCYYIYLISFDAIVWHIPFTPKGFVVSASSFHIFGVDKAYTNHVKLGAELLVNKDFWSRKITKQLLFCWCLYSSNVLMPNNALLQKQ